MPANYRAYTSCAKITDYEVSIPVILIYTIQAA